MIGTAVRNGRFTRRVGPAGLALPAVLMLWAASCATPRLAPGARMDVTLPVMGGGTFSFDDVRGKVVLVDVWASWCRPCAQSVPFTADLETAFAPRGFAVVGINIDEDERAAAAFLRAHNLKPLTLRDPGGVVVGSRFTVARMPTMFLLDRAGRVRSTREGFNARDKDALRDLVSKLLAEPPPAVPADGDAGAAGGTSR